MARRVRAAYRGTVPGTDSPAMTEEAPRPTGNPLLRRCHAVAPRFFVGTERSGFYTLQKMLDISPQTNFLDGP